MLLSLFRKYCCILWNHQNYQQIIWLFLLLLLSQQLQRSDAKPTKWNHSIQRRFMWKQMDSTVDGFVGRVVTGARVMKSMIGDFIPSKQISSNVMDYLPTETTRIKYIIRDPHTKETKVIRVRPSKKVVKLMAMTPKPLSADKPKSMHVNEPEHVADKLKPVHIKKEPEHMTADKFRSMYMMDPDKLRLLEREQELIVEGRIPITREIKPIYMAYKAEKQKDVADNVVSGKIPELNDSWKPVYKLGDRPAGFTTAMPYMMSVLHTSIVGEPQKQVYEQLTSNDIPEEEPKKSHTYEVTEYTAEESVIHPHTRDYYNTESPSASLLPQTEELSPKPFPINAENPNTIAQIGDESAPKTYHKEYHSQRAFLPTRASYILNEGISTTTSAPSITSTTEEPNYPAIFLKKIRSRPDSFYSPKVQQRNRSSETSTETSWLPSNTTYTSQRDRQVPYNQQLASISLTHRTKSQKWPPDAENTYYNTDTLLAHVVSSTTAVPDFQDFTTQGILSNSNSRKNVRLKSPYYSSFTEAKHRIVRNRGSVKYGDKLEIEDR